MDKAHAVLADQLMHTVGLAAALLAVAAGVRVFRVREVFDVEGNL